MSWRVSTDWGDEYTRAPSATKARAQVAWRMRSRGFYVPAGAAEYWEVVRIG